MPRKRFNYQLSDYAIHEVETGYFWYEDKQPGLGERFLKSLDEAKKAIVRNPESFGFRYKNRVRGFPVHKFPFLILYVISDSYINVISVFNTNQHPKKWGKRV